MLRIIQIFFRYEINVILAVHETLVDFHSKLWSRSVKENTFDIALGFSDSAVTRVTRGSYIRTNNRIEKNSNGQCISTTKHIIPQNSTATPNTRTNKPYRKYKMHDIPWYTPIWGLNILSRIVKHFFAALDRCLP